MCSLTATALLRRIGYVMSQTMAGAKTRQIHQARGSGGKAYNALLPCFCTAHYIQMQCMLLYFYAPSVLTGSRF